MQKVCICLVFFLSWMVSSQPKFKTMPEGTKQIHFTYTCSLNIRMTEEGLFADTLFLKYVLKNEPFEIRKQDENASANIGFIPLKKIKENYNLYTTLKSLLYHTNQTYYGIYDVAENKTIIKVTRGDADSRFIFSSYFEESFEPFDYTIEYDFKSATRKIRFPAAHYESNL